MAGQIIPRGRNKWLVRIYVGRHPKTGKHKYVGKVINGTKKDAQAYLNAKLREQVAGVNYFFLWTTTRSTDPHAWLMESMGW